MSFMLRVLTLIYRFIDRHILRGSVTSHFADVHRSDGVEDG